MHGYLTLLERALREGEWENNRTQVRTLTLPGAMLQFDLREGFPAITTRKLAFRSFSGELVGFLRQASSAATFRELGVRFWNANANENRDWLANPYRRGTDDLGRIYGVQWRQWTHTHFGPLPPSVDAQPWTLKGHTTQQEPIYTRHIDQVGNCLRMIHTQPESRRILFHAWNPGELEEMALPPCHLLYQFHVHPATRELSLYLYQRSADLALGVVGNITTGSLLLSLFGHLSGYSPRYFTWFGAHVHLYETHLDMVRTQLQRSPYPAPQLDISPRIPAYRDTQHFAPEWLDQVEPTDFTLLNYQHHPAITAPMAV